MMLRRGVRTCTADEFGAMVADMNGALANRDLADTMKEVATLIDKAIGRNFATQEGPHSSQWPARKRNGGGQERGDGHPLLIKSGDLFQAATSPFGRGHIEDVDQTSAAVGVDHGTIEYAMAQNFGHTYSDGRVLPQREYGDITDSDEDQIVEMVADGIIALWL